MKQRFLKGAQLPPHLGWGCKHLLQGTGSGRAAKDLFSLLITLLKERDIHSNCDYKVVFLWTIPAATFVYLAWNDLY